MAREYVYQNEEVNNSPANGGGVSDKLTFLLVGSGIGAALALLFAPKSGRELRGDIADATRKGYDKSRETAQQLRAQSGTYYQQIKERGNEAYNRTTNRLRSSSSSVNNTGESNTNKQLDAVTEGNNSDLV